MDYHIRKMKAYELDKYNNIWDVSLYPTRTKFWRNQLLEGNRVTFVYVQEDEFLGECSLMKSVDDPHYTIKDERIHLSLMMVKEEYRGCGIGSKLLDAIIDYSRENGYSEISVEVDLDNIGARKLYERKGFTTFICEDEDEAGKFIKLVKIL